MGCDANTCWASPAIAERTSEAATFVAQPSNRVNGSVHPGPSHSWSNKSIFSWLTARTILMVFCTTACGASARLVSGGNTKFIVRCIFSFVSPIPLMMVSCLRTSVACAASVPVHPPPSTLHPCALGPAAGCRTASVGIDLTTAAVTCFAMSSWCSSSCTLAWSKRAWILPLLSSLTPAICPRKDAISWLSLTACVSISSLAALCSTSSRILLLASSSMTRSRSLAGEFLLDDTC
mmetsp:Transcript_24996/g.54746  ORF Transcript_24996/g.54746 Transcript_24996/m.54746 type:complete len:235 (-) Transcript_24996:372-1076(-)